MPDSRAAWDFLRDAERLRSSEEVSLAIRRLAAEKFAPELSAPGKHRSYAMSGLRRRGRAS
jgi:hypothetical protein